MINANNEILVEFVTFSYSDITKTDIFEIIWLLYLSVVNTVFNGLTFVVICTHGIFALKFLIIYL